MAFDRYGDNLETTLQNPRLSMLPLFHVKEIARQLLQAIRYLHDNGIVHTDLKPSKIVFVSNETVKHRFYGMDNIFHHRTILKTAEIRILDFGGGHRLTSEPHQSGMIGSAGFRAPDVIMEWPLTETVDHFALGCIIAQMLTSKPLLPTLAGSKIEEVAFMDKILGPFPDNLTKTVQKDMLPAFDHRNNWGSSTFSDTKQQQLKNAKTVSEQIEDRDAAKLIRMLTNVDATKRGDLHHHEKCKFVATYEM
ncbi:kinase-like domain-containing protein [Mycena polygramma]|nr:kinase-like domain-containing protein [Mycena polygramma]